MQNRQHAEIDLMRGGRLVSTLTGAFGQSIRETRLTALLGYLIAIDPSPFMDLFGIPGQPQRVCLETRHEDGRSDILVETSRGVGIIEAKIDATDPIVQSRKYGGRWVALLTHRVPQKKTDKLTKYVSWNELAGVLKKLEKSPSPRLKILSADLLAYLKEHRMIRQRESVEIYAREINEPVTLKLFLRGQLYSCQYQAGSRIAEALYFAPHFGKSIAGIHVGVAVGISYIAKIKSVGQATTWTDFQELTIQERGRTWWNQHRELLTEMRRSYKWNSTTHRSFLFLDKPRLAFNPPVKKENLQKGKGWLSKRFLSFDDLFAAWGL